MEAQARGGAGIVTTQGAFTDKAGAGRGYVGMMAIWDDKFIPGLKKIADVIHKHDALATLQLMHCGRVGGIELPHTDGPSEVPQKLPIFRPPREMTKEDIESCIQEHVAAARRTAEAGYDIVVGYLLSNFISSYTNKRTDEYGGDIKGRCKLMVDIIKGIRREIGDSAAIGIRLCGDEILYDRGGNTPEESIESIKMAAEAGCDYISVTAGWQESPDPVSMAYRLFLPQYPEEAIARGELDFWEMCRPMIADPFLPKKILEGREEDIIPCIACNVCLARLFRDTELCCTVRPSLGHEADPAWGFYGFPKTVDPQRVVIVGAGIAGMQAGAIAAEKGHDVTIYEKKSYVGGQMAVAANGPWGDNELMRLVSYLKTTCEKQGARIVLNKAVSAEELKKEKADTIIIATGALIDRESVPGSDKNAKWGKQVVIVGGLGVAISTALYIIDKDKEAKVSIVGPQKKLGGDVNPSYIWRYMKKLKEGGVVQVTQTNVKEITDDGLSIITPDKKEETMKADTVVLAMLVPNKEIKYGKYQTRDVYMIGDCVQVRRGYAAVHDGYNMGMQIDLLPYQTFHREQH